MTVSQYGARLRSGQISCVELIEEVIAACRERDRFHSLITETFDQARSAAVELDRELASGIDRGPFHGIPIAHKDNYETKGVRTTAGSLLYRDHVPGEDAEVVHRFREGGAISLGKTNLHELAFGITSKNPHYGSVLNPLDLNRIAGGSSGGSAALVAAGILPFATGSDTGGSIRVPASFCGIVGLKPTYGRVSRRGLFPLAFSLDCPGPLASCVDDCALGLEVMTGETGFRPQPLPSLQGIRIGLAEQSLGRVTPDVAHRFRQVFDLCHELKAEFVEVEINSLNEINAVARIVQLGETAALLARYDDPTLFGNDLWALIQQGKSIPAHEYINAQRLRTLFCKMRKTMWKDADILLTPTTPSVAPLLSENEIEIAGEKVDVRVATTSLVRGWNLTGEPAISVPCPRRADELPVGFQLIAGPWREKKLLTVAATLERALA